MTITGMSRHLCQLPRSLVTPSFAPSSAFAAVPPRAQIALGFSTINWRKRNSPQISISWGSGVRFCGGRHLTTLQM